MGKKISRRSFIKKSIATAAMTGMSSILLTQQAPANVILNRKPNILFILNDQERAWPFIQKNVNLPARRYLESISTYFNRSYTSLQYAHLQEALFTLVNIYSLQEFMTIQ